MIGENRHRQYVADAGSASTTSRIEALEKIIANVKDLLCKSGRDGKNDASAREEETEHDGRDSHTAEPNIGGMRARYAHSAEPISGRMRAIHVGNGSNDSTVQRHV